MRSSQAVIDKMAKAVVTTVLQPYFMSNCQQPVALGFLGCGSSREDQGLVTGDRKREISMNCRLTAVTTVHDSDQTLSPADTSDSVSLFFLSLFCSSQELTSGESFTLRKIKFCLELL